MALSILFGLNETPDTNIAGGYFAATVCPALTKACIARRAAVYPLVNGNVKPAIYKVGAGDADTEITGTKMWSIDTDVAVLLGGWREVAANIDELFAIGDVPAVACNGSASGVMARKAETATGYDRKLKSATYSTYTAPTPTITGLTKTANAAQAMLVYGYWEPTITSVGGDNILDEADEGDVIAVVGTDFLGDSATGVHKAELCNDATYGSATIKVPQQITAVSDTEISVVYNRNGLLGAGTVYLFITTDLGLRNAIGFSVKLSGIYLNRTQSQRRIVSGNVGVNGYMFGSANGTYELGEAASYDGCTIKVAQTIVEWSDRKILSTVNLTGLSAYSTVYGYVTSAQGGRTTLPLSFAQDTAVGPAVEGQTHSMRYRKRERRT